MRAVLLACLASLLAFSCGAESHIVEGGTDTANDTQDLTAAFTVSPTTVSVAPGSSGSVTVAMGGSGTTPWTLSVSGLSAGVKGSFDQATIHGGLSATLTLSASASAAVATATATVTATTAKGTIKSASLSVQVAKGGGSGVGPTGGTVDLLHFVVTGDTRPPSCGDTAGYPTPIINAIADAAQAKSAQFGLDLGDHMYVCNNSLADATTHMGLYTQAVARFKSQWFMTMGNHECSKSPCLSGSSNANYVAFMSALSKVSPTPYYSFDVHTRLGLATFVVIADNAWDSTQATWLENTLATADKKATYTIVARHHPPGDTSVSTNADSAAIVRAHKFALFLTGHSHLYKHMTTDGGRDVVIGIGGAPLLAAGSDFNGYALVDQGADGRLTITVYNVSGDLVRDTFTVSPN